MVLDKRAAADEDIRLAFDWYKPRPSTSSEMLDQAGRLAGFDRTLRLAGGSTDGGTRGIGKVRRAGGGSKGSKRSKG